MDVWLLGLFQLIIIIFVCIKEVQHKSSTALMWATLLIMFGVPHFLICVIGQDEYKDLTINKCSVFVILFCIAYIGAREIIWRQTGIKRNKKEFQYSTVLWSVKTNDTNADWIKYLFYAIVIFQVLTLIKAVGGIHNITWANIYESSGKLSYFNFKTLFHFMYFAFGGVLCIQILKGDKLGVVVSSGAIVINTLADGGNRIDILPLVVSFIVYFIFRTDRIKIKTLIIASFLGVCAIYCVYGILILRHYGNMFDAVRELSITDVTDRILMYIRTGKGELGLRKVFYYFMENNGQFENFGKAHTYIRMLLVYIPTKLSMGIKPPDFAVTMGAASGMDAGLSTHPTLFGDCYANFGWFGILAGVLWAFYVSIIDRVILRTRNIDIRVLIYVLVCCSYVIIGRGSVYNGFIEVAYGVVLIMLVYIFHKSFGFKIRMNRVLRITSYK